MKPTSIIFCFILAISFLSCRKEHFITSANATIELSRDTLFFDTVFVTKGSVVKLFKIYNTNDQKLKLASIKLAGGTASAFKVNIDGVPAAEVSGIELNANDSMYVFVQVNVDPDDRLLPFIVSDSIQIVYNGNTRWMQLRAYGQNAVFLKDEIISANTLWKDSLPYVVSGSLKIDSNAVLNIEAGTRIFMHATAPVLVYGTIHASGTLDKPIVFAGDRRDEDYRDLPAAWPGIYFMPSSEQNYFKHTVIKNAYQGIVLQGLPSENIPKLRLSQSIIKNIYDAGILSLNASIEADNSLIANCGSNLALLMGGKHTFTNCTIASYGNIYLAHKNPVLQVTDYYEEGGTLFTENLSAVFTNCIFWGDNGNVDNEIFTGKKGNGLFDVQFINSIYKAKDNLSNAHFINSLLNTPPLFDSINTAKSIYDFHITANPASPAINAGVPTSYLYDLDGKVRDAQPDIGCYEK